jgi:small nuclear ribonucleoprotein (snRNP)-like protein
MSNQNDYIGKSIYVITKAEVRYEGTLIDVDREKKIMSLRNVSQKGTEGRRNGENEIPPNDSILGMVKFKVELIKEFNIIS